MNRFFYKWKMRQVFKEDLILSETVQDRIQETYDSIRTASIKKETEVLELKNGAGNRKPVKRMVVIAAVAGLILAMTGAVVYATASNAVFFQAMFGNQGRSSTKGKVEYAEDGELLVQAETERVEVDERQAETLLGDYVSEIGKSFTVGKYTITVEKNVIDTAGRIGSLYLCLEQGGKPVENVYIEKANNDEIYDRDGWSISMFLGREKGSVGDRVTYDRANSTPEKVYISISYILFSDWDKNDPLYLSVDTPLDEQYKKKRSKITIGSDFKSLTATTLYDGDKAVGTISPLGVSVDCAALYNIPPLQVLENGTGDVSLEYTDGTRYIIDADKADGGSIINSLYACISDEGRLTYSFNRLVDPKQVAKVFVGDKVIHVK